MNAGDGPRAVRVRSERGGGRRSRYVSDEAGVVRRVLRVGRVGTTSGKRRPFPPGRACRAPEGPRSAGGRRSAKGCFATSAVRRRRQDGPGAFRGRQSAARGRCAEPPAQRRRCPMGADGRPGVRLHAGECGSRRCGVAFRRKEDGAEPPARRRRCPMGADGRPGVRPHAGECGSRRCGVAFRRKEDGAEPPARRRRCPMGADGRPGVRPHAGRRRDFRETDGEPMPEEGARYPLRRRRSGRDFVRGARGRNKDCECARSKIERRRQFPIYINDIAKQKPRQNR